MIPEETAGTAWECDKCGEQIKLPLPINTQQAKAKIIKTILHALIASKTLPVQSKPNKFIETFKNLYDESLRLLDEETSQLINSGSDLKAIKTFTGHVGNIGSVHDYLKNMYSLIYRSMRMLEHFNSSKLGIKQIPLSFCDLDKYSLNGSQLKIYEELLRERFHYYLDEDGEFKDRDYQVYFEECFVNRLLNESGYNKKHWYLKDVVLNEIEFMFDYLLEFVEEDFSPITNDNIENSDDKNKDRYISKETRVAVWRRDLGKCVQCGSQEKLEYDHIIPVSKGGSNTERNIQLLCERCNRTKSNSL
ncbi:HNH endonuclease signature motif containing protein [Gimesia sp.]|uniref:HNH endonuclease n=1 Tax=Gimesia sp. TaxID=2024833 RepID=UPI0032EF6309